MPTQLLTRHRRSYSMSHWGSVSDGRSRLGGFFALYGRVAHVGCEMVWKGSPRVPQFAFTNSKHETEAQLASLASEGSYKSLGMAQLVKSCVRQPDFLKGRATNRDWILSPGRYTAPHGEN